MNLDYENGKKINPVVAGNLTSFGAQRNTGNGHMKYSPGNCLPDALPVPASVFLSRTALSGLEKVGKVCLPGATINGKRYPAYSGELFQQHVDRLLQTMEPDDQKGLNLLLEMISVMPLMFVRALVLASDKGNAMPNWPGLSQIGTVLRMISFALKGPVLTLYYSELNSKPSTILKQIGYNATIHPHAEDLATPFLKERQVSHQTILTSQTESNFTPVMVRARQAQREIAAMSVQKRLEFIRSLYKVILNEREKIIDLIQADNKKSRTDALTSEIFGILDHLHFLMHESGKTLRNQKVKTPIALMGKKSEVVYDPMGVCLIISPWNYPFYQAIVPITTSFVAGNATLYKPSEFTPLTGLVERVLELAGWKNDWVQVIYGDGNTGKGLIDQRPDKIFFTGSVNTGKKIMAHAAQYLIPVELELGGKDPMIVFEDANMDRAVAGALWGSLTNTGQSCTSVERLFVHHSIYEQFKHKLVAQAALLRQGIDKDGSAEFGMMTTESQTKIVKEHLDDALAKGAKLLSGTNWNRTDLSIPALILEQVSRDMKVWTEESFGPFIVLMPFYTEEEVVGLANDSVYGLSASVWTADKARSTRVMRSLVTGNVSINNVMLTEGNHFLPFGGTKLSGIGRYKGVWGLWNFSNMKSVIHDGNSSKIEANWYPYGPEKYRLFSNLIEALFNGGPLSLLKVAIHGTKLEMFSAKEGKRLAEAASNQMPSLK